MLEQRTELRETHLPGYHVMKDVIEDADEQLGEGVHRASLRGSSVLMLLSPWGWGTSPSWYVDAFTSPESPGPLTAGIYGGFLMWV